MFASNEKMDAILYKNKVVFRKCGKEYGLLFIDGLEMEASLPQKPYYSLFTVNGKDVGELIAIDNGFAIIFDFKNRHHSNQSFVFTLNFESITYDELRDAYLINNRYYLYFSTGKIQSNNVVISASPLEHKKFFVLMAERSVFDKYLMLLSQEHVKWRLHSFNNDYFSLVEHVFESMNVFTKDKRYNDSFQYLKSLLIRMIKQNTEGFKLCKLKGEMSNEEIFLFIPYFVKAGGERVVRHLFLKHRDSVNNYLYLYALKHYVEHTTDFKFYDKIMKEKHKLRATKPRSIYEKLARLIYLNKQNDPKEVDAFMHELLLEEEKVDRAKLLLFLPFTNGHVHHVLKAFIVKDKYFRGFLYGLSENNYEVLNDIMFKEELAAFALMFMMDKVLKFEVDSLHQELVVNMPEKQSYEKAKLVYNDVVNLQVSYDLAKKRLFVDYNALDRLYTLRIRMPKEFEVLINGKLIGKTKEVIYEVI